MMVLDAVFLGSDIIEYFLQILIPAPYGTLQFYLREWLLPRIENALFLFVMCKVHKDVGRPICFVSMPYINDVEQIISVQWTLHVCH